jgi:hypothetical protein
MLNINAFFEFKQRTRHAHSFQLAQLIYHSQHLNDYYILAQNFIVESHRKKSATGSDDPVSILFINKNKFLKQTALRHLIFNTISDIKSSKKCDLSV